MTQPSLTLNFLPHAERLNPGSKLRLQAVVDARNLEPSTLTFAWAIPGVNLSAYRSTPASSLSLALSEQAPLLPGVTYQAQLSGAYAGGTPVTVTTRVTINQPPFGGSCSVSPLSVRSLNESFVATCTGWEDDGLSALSYELAYYETNSSALLAFSDAQLLPLVAAQPFSSIAFRLPFSDPLKLLVVTMCDTRQF